MGIIKTVRGFTPQFGNNCFLAENSTIVGEVIMGDNCSVWFNAVVRGDVNFIHIGNNVNIQDGAVIHGTYERASVTIGNNVSIAHNVVIHGCTIHDNVAIGIGAIILDGAVINSNTFIAAGAVVLNNTEVPANSVYAGIPAKKIKDITDNLSIGEINRISKNYLLYSTWYK